ncbi:ATP-dependent Clp protease ATP-binding subunit [bacterium]|nr:ATP-dependent Clp protease ATP-binding subunit [bacterium]
MKIYRHTSALYGTSFGYVAVLLDDPDYTAHGSSAEEAQQNLTGKIQEALKENPWMGPPETDNYQVHVVPVEVRPEYRTEKQVLPQEYAFEFRFACAVGEVEGGLKMCVVPSLAMQFYFEGERSLRELVGHYVQDKLKGLTPAQLLRFVAPDQLELRQCRIKKPAVDAGKGAKTWPQLEAVAELAHQSKLRGYGREGSLKELIHNLQAGLSVALVGASSVGKTTLLIEAARRTKNLWRTSAARLIAGMSYLGMWEERCEKVIDQLGKASGILAVDSVAELIRQGGQDPGSSIAAFITPFVMDGQLQLVVEATPGEWQACRRLLPGFADLFRVQTLEPMTDPETLEVLGWVRSGLRIGVDVDETLVSLFRRFSPYEALPGSAVRFLRRVGGAKRGTELTRSSLVEAFSKQSSIPEEFLLDEVCLDPTDLETQICRRVIGQPQAQQAALRIITAFKAGLQDPSRPLGVLLLCGPTGAGKTELAKTLADVLFSDEKRLIRLDMSEYSGAGSADRLLGSVYEKAPATWLRELRQKPFSVVLFDEVEKAHPEVFDVLMRAFDEGHLSDPWGRTTSLRTCVLLLTSNLGAEQQQTVGLRQGQPVGYAQAVYQFFRPELINRLDAVVPFQTLTPEVIRAVAEREVSQLEKRPGLKRRRLRLQATPACLEYLAQAGYDVRLGARPLQRLIERQLIPPLSEWLRVQEYQSGGLIHIDHIDGNFVLSLAPKIQAAEVE